MGGGGVPGRDSTAGGRDRVLASAIDYLVIVGWIALLTVVLGAVALARPLHPDPGRCRGTTSSSSR